MREDETVLSKRLGNVIRDNTAFRVTLSKEIESLKLKKDQGISIELMEDKHGKKIVLRPADNGM